MQKAIINGMLTEFMHSPIGIDCVPRFTWKIEGTSALQVGFELTVYNESGKAVYTQKEPSQASVCVVYSGDKLEARTRYFWNVKVFFDDSTEFVSDMACFETGLMDEGFSGAKWIIQNGTDIDKDKSAPMFRKEFEIAKTPVRARLYATAAGLYDAYVNGSAVDNSILNPARSEYQKHLMYQTFDVTQLIKTGKNVVGTVLGRGWYIGACSSYGGIYPAFVAKLVITFEDGSEQVIATDSSWKYCTDGPILFNDIFDGETYDAQREKDGWSTAGYDDSAWNEAFETKREFLNIGEPISQLSGLVKPMLTLKAVELTQPENGVYIYDFGQNLAGVVRVKLKGKKGTTVTLRHAEFLNDSDSKSRGCDGKKGTLYTANLRSAKATDKYILKGDENGEIYSPRFTFHGFRYVEITGVDEPLALEDVEADALYSEMKVTGDITLSSDIHNRLFQNAMWGQRGNFLSTPTDCPQRDERMGWTGDAQVFAGTACYNMDTALFYEKYLLDMVDCQKDNGAYSDVAPGATRKDYSNAGNGGWADAGIIIPWVIYHRYNDKRPIERNYDSMCRYIEFLVNKSNGTWVNKDSFYGDWLSMNEETPKSVTDTAYSAYSCRLMAEMAAVIGKTDDSNKFNEYADKFAAAWCKNFLCEDGKTTCDTQTSYVLGLYFGIIPDAMKEAAVKNLVRRIAENSNKITTGFLGVSYILPVLCDYGYADVALGLFEQREYPSWIYPVLQGATTIWERWNSYTIDKGFGDAGMNSFNHYSFGSVAEWMYKYLAGIRTADGANAFKRILLKPIIAGSIESVSAEYDSFYGKIKSGWSRENDEVTYNCTVPCNTTATLVLPDGSETLLRAGEHQFTFKI